MPGLSGARTMSVPESVTARLNFLHDRVRLVEHVDRALLARAGRRHLARRVLEVADARADPGIPRLRHHERLSEAAVEALGDVAHQLDVLALVLPHRHLVRAVREDVGRHQHGVEEQAGGHELALGDGLVAELVHALELAERGDARQQPGELGVLLDVGLAEQDAALGIEAGRDQQRLEVVAASRSVSGS